MNSTAIEMLIIEPSPNAAERHISALRNAGLAVHSNCVSDQDDVRKAADEKRFDLILFSANSAPDDLLGRVKTCLEAIPNTPLVILYQDQDPNQLLQAMRDGARDVVCEDDLEHLELVIKRELEDLLTRRRLEAMTVQLSEADARCSALIDHSHDAIAYIHEGMHVRANPVYLSMFGYVDMDDLECVPILDMIAPSDIEKFKRFLRTTGTEHSDLEVLCRSSDGEAFDAKLEFSPASIDGEPCTQIIIRDNSSDKKLEQKLQMVTNMDPQTGLANRQYFMEQTELLFADGTQPEGSHWVFYVTADNFQKIRSEIGLAASDALMREFAEVLNGVAEKSDLLARFGDHTFALLSKRESSSDAETLAASICSTTDRHLFRVENKQLEPTVSVGIACADGSTPNSQELINHAYQACEAARSEGGNRHSVYNDEEMRASFGASASETELNNLIKHALDNDRFRLVFQPIVSLHGESRELYAVLTRLVDNNEEEILPEHFMKDAEQAGQMAEIDRWVIQHAISELATQRKDGRKVSFFVSLSAESLADGNLLLWICDCLRDHKARGAWLTFQVAGNDLRSHLQESKKLFEGLKKIQCQIAIDQYGSSPKSEALLKHLPVDYVKFSSELVEKLTGQQDHLSELNQKVQEYDVKTIAMGVEDANSLAMLWTSGVNYIQGYFLQEPSESISYDFTSP